MKALLSLYIPKPSRIQERNYQRSNQGWESCRSTWIPKRWERERHSSGYLVGSKAKPSMTKWHSGSNWCWRRSYFECISSRIRFHAHRPRGRSPWSRQVRRRPNPLQRRGLWLGLFLPLFEWWDKGQWDLPCRLLISRIPAKITWNWFCSVSEI